MSVVPLFGFDQKGRSATVTAQRHLNLFADIKKDQDKASFAFYGTPGTTLRVSFGDTPVRGWIAIGDVFYCVHRGTFYEVNNAGTKTSRGTITTTSGRVDMAYNGVLILITTGTNLYTYTISGASFALVTDGDAPQAAKTVTWLSGQFVVDQGTGDIFQTSADGLAWDALDFAAAETNPDGLIRVFSDSGQLLLLGENTIEYWGNIGAADFPFAAIQGATQEFGLAARWSLCKYNSGVAGLMHPKIGQVQVMFITNYVPKPISTPEIDYIINNYTTVSDATAYAYMLGGHPMYQINFPSASASWLYDMSTGLWSPLEYGLDGARHRAEMGLNYLDKTIVADYSNGDIYNLREDTYTDNGTAIARELIGRHFFDANERHTVDELYIDMETGVGLVSGQGSAPMVSLNISKDNGHTYGADLLTSIGALGKYLTRVVWRRLGIARDWTFKLRVTDPIKVVITFAAIKVR